MNVTAEKTVVNRGVSSRSITFGPHVTLLVAAAAIWGCGAEPRPDAVAVYNGGEVTLSELDRAVLELPPDERAGLAGSVANYEELVREMVVDRLLLVEARDSGVNDSGSLNELIEERKRSRVTDLCLRERLPPAAVVTEEDARAHYDEHRDRFHRPGRRLVQNIFLRLDAGDDPEPARREALAVRQRVLDGEGFSSLAREASDSESRHQGGLIGWVGRGETPPKLEELIFALEPGVPSEPVATRDGFHLFYVETAIEEKIFSFEETRPQIVQQLRAERQNSLVDDLIGERDPPDGSFVPTPQELLDRLATGDPETLILRFGAVELKAARFVQILGVGQREGASGDARSRAPLILETIRKREEVRGLCLSENWLDDRSLEAARLEIEDQMLINAQRTKRLQGLVDMESEIIEEFFQRNRKRYATPLRFNLRRLTVPAGTDASATMARLEGLDAEIGTGVEPFQELAAELGGNVDELGWKTLDELAVLEPKIAQFAVAVKPGELSSPFSVRNELVALQLVERWEPESRSLNEVFKQVRDDYVAQHIQELYRELESEILDEAGFRLIEGRIEAMFKI